MRRHSGLTILNLPQILKARVSAEDVTKLLGELANPVPEDLVPGMKPPKHEFSVGQVWYW